MLRIGNSKVLLFSVLFVQLFMIAFVSGLQNPFGVIVREQFGLGNAAAQTGNLANFIAYALMGYPAGKILERHGYRKTSLAAVAIGFAGVLVQCIAGSFGSFPLLVAGAFIAGFSMCMMNTLVNPLLNTLGGGGKSGNRLLQFGGAFYTLGGMAVPYVVGMLISGNVSLSAASPVLMFSMGVFVLAFAAWALLKEPDVRPPVSPESGNSAGRRRFGCLSFRHFVLGAVAVFLYMGVEVGIANTANIYLAGESGVPSDTAGLVISLYWLLMVAGRILGGIAGGRMSSRAMLASVSAAALLFVLCFIFMPDSFVFRSGQLTGVPLSVSFLVLCGLCVAVMWGNIFNLAVDGLGKYTSSASGIFMIMVCGGGIVPALQGIVSDRFGCIPSFWVTAACLVYILFYSLKGSRHSL